MDLLNKVKINNPIVFSIIKNSIENKKVSHAYIFSGPKNIDIIDEPTLLANAIISQNPFKEKLENIKTYSDFQIIDGSKSLIKKEQVLNASNVLQQTSLDSRGIKILMIKNIENGNKQSLNSLLKFIEEPTPNTFIIMTTNNLSQVISTIRSRAQIINVKSISFDKHLKSIEESEIKTDNKRILASITKSKEEAINVSESKLFDDAVKNIAKIMFDALEQPEKIITDLGSLLTRDSFSIYLNILRTFLNDIWKLEQEMKISFIGEEEILKKYTDSSFNFQSALHLINDFLVSLKSNVNFNLYKSQFLIKWRGCYG